MLTIPFVLLVLAILVSLASVICHVALPSILRVLDSVAPELRAQILLFVAGAPWLIGASVLMSSLGDIFFGACDFGSACLWNEDPAGIRPESILAALPLLCATIFLCARAVRQRLISRRVLSAFDAASDLVADSAVRVIPNGAAFAFAGGGRVYVSSAIQDRLSPDQYRAVVLHEQAHIRRHDGLTVSIARILAGSYLPPFRRRLLNALALANEQCCDAHAASFVGRDTVAAAILAVERMAAELMRGDRRVVAGLPGFGDGFVAPRVRRLLNIEPPPANFGIVRTGVVLTLLFAFLAGDVLYYLAMMILYPRL
jgi:Zn-dependent protease with chaperone function